MSTFTCECGFWKVHSDWIEKKDGITKRICPYCQTDFRTKEEDKSKFEDLYYDLIFEVVCAYPGETRHETAKRYIHERENRPSSECSSVEIPK